MRRGLRGDEWLGGGTACLPSAQLDSRAIAHLLPVLAWPGRSESAIMAGLFQCFNLERTSGRAAGVLARAFRVRYRAERRRCRGWQAAAPVGGPLCCGRPHGPNKYTLTPQHSFKCGPTVNTDLL